MDEARIDRAVNRIQGALDRIEQAALPAIQAGSGRSDVAGAREARIRAALAQLDMVIESLEQ